MVGDKTYKALIIDDEINARLLISELLSFHYPEVSEIDSAQNTIEANVLIKANKYDIIFSDSRMPFENGMSVLNSIQDRKIQLILTTAYDKTATLNSNHSLYYLQKPIDIDDFKQVINHALDTLQLFEKYLKF